MLSSTAVCHTGDDLRWPQHTPGALTWSSGPPRPLTVALSHVANTPGSRSPSASASSHGRGLLQWHQRSCCARRLFGSNDQRCRWLCYPRGYSDGINGLTLLDGYLASMNIAVAGPVTLVVFDALTDFDVFADCSVL